MPAHLEIAADKLRLNPFAAIGKDWMLICAGKEGKTNAMTASWGGLGVMWGRNVAFVVIRPQRYTKEFVDGSDAFSLNFFADTYREKLNYFGAVSGRDEDKIGKTGMTVNTAEAAPYFEESHTAILCKKLFAQPYSPDAFIAPDVVSQWYPKKDFHTLYIAEVTKILAV